VADLDLRPERRQAVVDRIVAALSNASPESCLTLRGSLATDAADVYSDIDLYWVVPDATFEVTVAGAARALGQVERVVSLRLDPAYARSDRRRLIFARLAGLPLFWRVDLEVRAASVANDDSYDADNPAARSEQGWSRPTSAIENAVAAIKAVLRHQPGVAEGLLRRGYERIGHALDPAATSAQAIVSLAQACAGDDSALEDMAAQVHHLVDALIGDLGG